MNKLKRTGYKYDAAYIKYVENGESKAVYITRDIVEAINTDGKWIDVLDIDSEQWVPSDSMTPSCEWRKRRMKMKPEWEYQIKKVQKL